MKDGNQLLGIGVFSRFLKMDYLARQNSAARSASRGPRNSPYAGHTALSGSSPTALDGSLRCNDRRGRLSGSSVPSVPPDLRAKKLLHDHTEAEWNDAGKLTPELRGASCTSQ
jgi:hypothetical protein